MSFYKDLESQTASKLHMKDEITQTSKVAKDGLMIDEKETAEEIYDKLIQEIFDNNEEYSKWIDRFHKVILMLTILVLLLTVHLYFKCYE